MGREKAVAAVVDLIQPFASACFAGSRKCTGGDFHDGGIAFWVSCFYICVFFVAGQAGLWRGSSLASWLLA